jgi:3-oxoacyl-[acyl-carrier protein] reductase
MSHSLHGKVALVTGNSTGLGKAIGQCLGLAGAKVPVNFAHNEARGRQALEEYQQAGIETALIQADVTSESDVDRMFSEIESQLGPVDIIVANATCEQPLKPIEEYDWAFYQRMIDFFIKSPFLLAQRGLPHMKKQKWGRLSQELAPDGITVNMVAPGWIPVERHESDPQQMKDEYLSMIPMGRWGKPEDVGHTVTFLASDEAAFVTGQTTCVNGGMSPW